MPVLASTFVAMTEDELVAQSDRVIQGEVINIQSRWSNSGRIIVSDARVRVDHSLLGRGPAVVTVRTVGGEVNGFNVEAHGFPAFDAGEKVILYLRREASDDSLRVLGYQQGYYRVVTRRDGVTLAVPQVDGDVQMLRADGSRVAAPASVEIGLFRARLKARAERLGRRDIG